MNANMNQLKEGGTVMGELNDTDDNLISKDDESKITVPKV